MHYTEMKRYLYSKQIQTVVSTNLWVLDTSSVGTGMWMIWRLRRPGTLHSLYLGRLCRRPEFTDSTNCCYIYR